MTQDTDTVCSPLATTHPPQYGQSLVTRSPAGGVPGVVTVAKDCVRWKAPDPSGIWPVRVYLGPWQPQAALIPGPPPVADVYATPTPWSLAGSPQIWDEMSSGFLYARVSFGAGGVQHTAYLDWPRRGLLFQVACSYVQVDGISPEGGIGNFGFPEKLPIIAASMSIEPGGGDAAEPATFTYPRQEFADSGLFQIPPFARAFRLLMQNANPVLASNVLIEIIGTASIQESWNYDGALVSNDSAAERRYSLPGQEAQIVRITNNAPGGAPVFVGVIFYLDL